MIYGLKGEPVIPSAGAGESYAVGDVVYYRDITTSGGINMRYTIIFALNGYVIQGREYESATEGQLIGASEPWEVKIFTYDEDADREIVGGMAIGYVECICDITLSLSHSLKETPPRKPGSAPRIKR